MDTGSDVLIYVISTSRNEKWMGLYRWGIIFILMDLDFVSIISQRNKQCSDINHALS